MKNKPRIPFEVGQRYGKLVILYRLPNKDRVFLCACDCGNFHRATGQNLRHSDPSKRSWSCGCIRRGNKSRWRHGHCSNGKLSPTRVSWNGMIQRCSNPNFKGYSTYGGRGIFVDERWRNFRNFLEDMGERPVDMTLDRIDVDGPYSPKNCRWADKATQTANRRPYTLIQVSRLRAMEAKLKELGVEI